MILLIDEIHNVLGAGKSEGELAFKKMHVLICVLTELTLSSMSAPRGALVMLPRPVLVLQ